MTECERIKSLIADPGVPDLSREQVGEVFDHVAGCPSCLEAFERASLLEATIADALVEHGPFARTNTVVSRLGALFSGGSADQSKALVPRAPTIGRRSMLKLAGTSIASVALGAAGYAETKRWLPGSVKVTPVFHGEAVRLAPGTPMRAEVIGRNVRDWSLYSHSETIRAGREGDLMLSLPQGPAVIRLSPFYEGKRLESQEQNYSAFTVLDRTERSLDLMGQQSLRLASIPTLDGHKRVVDGGTRRLEMLLRVAPSQEMFQQFLSERLSVSLFANVRLRVGSETVFSPSFEGADGDAPRNLYNRYSGAAVYISNKAMPPGRESGCLVSSSYPNEAQADGFQIDSNGIAGGVVSFEADVMTLDPRQPSAIGLTLPFIDEEGWDQEAQIAYFQFQRAALPDTSSGLGASIFNVVLGQDNTVVGPFEACTWQHINCEADLGGRSMSVSLNGNPPVQWPLGHRGTKVGPFKAEDYRFTLFRFGGGNWLPMQQSGA